MTSMGTLLSGSAPLRGRAGLELVVPTLDYQLTAQFWNITDPTLAVKVHAIVGGTPPTGASSLATMFPPIAVTSIAGSSEPY